MPSLSELIAQVDDPQLAEALRAEVRRRGADRTFGLAFEDSPEEIDLVGKAPARGDRVQRISEFGSRARYLVTAVHKATKTATIVPADDPRGESLAVLLSDLTVVVDSEAVVYPGLSSTGSVDGADLERSGDMPATRRSHVAIKGDNLHVLRALRYTHRASVDAIYIDPPYNTGNGDWVYNDRYSSKDDAYRHSKWLAFMNRRLRLARDLLKPTGVIIVAIGDDEHHRLRMLMDDVFGEHNFLNDITWEGVRRNDSTFGSTSCDYMVIFARDRERLMEEGVRWLEEKPGLHEVRAAATESWKNSGGNEVEATRLMSAWWRSNRGRFAKGLEAYTKVDGRGAYQLLPLIKPGVTSTSRYELLHPTTGEAFKTPDNGWRYSRSTMDQKIAEGLIYFGKDHTASPRYKRYLAEDDAEVPASVFSLNRSNAAAHLASILGDKRFPFPKDHTVLMRWLRMIAPDDAVILDFFGGSGSTLEAVMRLNDEDGGTRQCIIATSNEVGPKEARAFAKRGLGPGAPEWEAAGVYENVLRPRITTLLSDVRPDGSDLPATKRLAHPERHRVEFFDVTWINKRRVSLGTEFPRIAPLLWMRAGGYEAFERPGAPTRYTFTDQYAVLFEPDALNELATRLTDQHLVFVVTSSEAVFRRAVATLEGVECRQIFDDYLRSHP